MRTIPIMPFVFLALLLLPIKLPPKSLRTLAFSLWMMGGAVLIGFGVMRLSEIHAAVAAPVFFTAIILAVIVGIAKGKFVLAKTSQRNIERIEAMAGPQKPIHVYSLRSWIIIAVMVGIAVALNVLDVDIFWRGVVNLGIGLALVMSSLAYLSAVPAKAGPHTTS